MSRCERCEAAERTLADARAERDALQAQVEMLQRVIADKYPAPPNFYLRRLQTDLAEAQAQVDGLREALEALVDTADNVAFEVNTNAMDFAIVAARRALAASAPGWHDPTCACGSPKSKHPVGTYSGYLVCEEYSAPAGGEGTLLSLTNAVQNATAEAVVTDNGTLIPCGWWAKIVRLARELHPGRR